MFAPGTLIGGKYKILSVIGEGEGGMSTVYLAIDEKFSKTWAIKVANRNGVHDDNKAIQGLVADKNTLKSLSHRFLPRIVDVFENENSMMLVMDFIEGKSLQYWTTNNGACSEKNVIKWAKQLCDVVGYLHSENIIYRDLKPANIMLDNNDITLIDFGTARQFERIKNTVSLGTVGYAAPEQFVDDDMGKVDARTDIYCIGATLHHLVTGIDPQLNPSFVKKPIREVNPQLSEGLESIISKCLQNEQSARYQSCAELMVDLENYEDIGSTIRKKQRNKLILFATSATLTAIFAVVSIFGFFASKKQLSDDYNLIIQKASNDQITEEESIDFYREAIVLKSDKPEAYLNLIDMFLASSTENGNFSREEVSVIRSIDNGLDIRNSNGYSETILPLTILKQKNKSAYAEVCYKIGTALWYDYEVESERHASAVSWFERSKDSYPIAQTYIDIGKLETDIQRFQGQNRTEQMYDTYYNLWETLLKLKADSNTLSDNDTKLMIWQEIVNNITDKASYFFARTDKQEILSVLDELTFEAEELRNTTNLEAVKIIVGYSPEDNNSDSNKNSLLFAIHQAKIKINSVTE